MILMILGLNVGVIRWHTTGYICGAIYLGDISLS
jgi:hypothetical protein